MYAAHVVPDGVPHVRAPVHVCASDWSRSVLQTLLPHVAAESAHEAHAPAPSHEPFCPHVLCASTEHWSCGSVAAFASPHSPSPPAVFAAWLHAWQRPEHAVLQQTLSTQKPVAHWADRAHAAPVASCDRQTCGAAARSQNQLA